MRFEKVNATEMQRHHWRVGQHDAALGNKFEAAMLPFRATTIGLQKQRDRREMITMFVGEFGAEFEQERQTFSIERFARAHHAARRGTGTHLMQAASGFDPALQASTVKSMLQVVRAQIGAASR